jgi:hypothetical protein
MTQITNPTPALSPVECDSLLSILSIRMLGNDMIEYGNINTHIRTSFQKYGHRFCGILDVE